MWFYKKCDLKKIILVLVLCPFVILSQGISISGGSSQNNGTQLLTLGDGAYSPAKIQGRSSSIDLAYYQSLPLPIGYYTLIIGAEYSVIQTNYDFSETNPIYANYEETNEAIIPYMALRYRVLNIPNLFNAYASIGAKAYLSSLGYIYIDNVFEDYNYDYNLLIPFLGAGVNLNTRYFNVNPFINYQIDPIYFDDIGEIDAADLEDAISGAGIVTGVRFSIDF